MPLLDKKKEMIKKFLPFLAYAVVIIIVFGKALVPPEDQMIFGPDISRYHYWQRQLLGNSLREGIIPWWNPYIFSGEPYISHPQIPTWYPPNLFFVFLPTNVAVSWYFAGHIFLAMAAMYILSRNLSLTQLVAWAAGVAYGLSAYFVARIPAGHMDIIAASAWMPLVFISNIKYQISNKNLFGPYLAVAAITFALQLLAGHQMIAVYTLEAMGVAAAVSVWRQKSLWPLVAVLLTAVLGAGIAAVQILPNQQYIANSIRTFSFPAVWAQLGTPTIGHLLEFLDPYYFYSRLPDSGFGFEHVGYIGKVSLLFAAAAVVSWFVGKKKRWEIGAFLLIAVFGIWIWLGNNAPVDLFSWVRSWLPLYSQIRIPARHIVLFVLSASALFGLGLNLVKSRIIQIIMVGLLLIDLIPFAQHHVSLTPVPEKAEDKELIAILKKDEGLYRFLPNFYHGEPLREALEFNAPIAHKVQSVSGYDTPPLRNYYEFLLAANNYQFADVLQYSESIPPIRNFEVLNFLNVKYILVPISQDNIKGLTQFSLIKENRERGYRLYENKKVLPRFFVTCINRELQTVEVISYNSNEIKLKTDNSCDGYLNSSEVYYPGWEAYIDGLKVPLLAQNRGFRTVAISKGNHEVVLRYNPRIVLIGGLVSIASLLFILKERG